MPVKLTLAALMALLAKTLPKFLFNRALYKITGRKALVLVSIAVMLGVTLWLSPATADDRPARFPDNSSWLKIGRASDGDTIVLRDRTRAGINCIDAHECDYPYGNIATGPLMYQVG